MSISLTASITLLYPLAIWLGQGTVEPRVLAGLLVVAGLTRLPTLTESAGARWWLGGTLLLSTVVIWSNLTLPLKLYPVLVNVAMLCVFSYSLIHPPSMVERFVRLHEPELPPQAVGYMRRVTQVWCFFLALTVPSRSRRRSGHLPLSGRFTMD